MDLTELTNSEIDQAIGVSEILSYVPRISKHPGSGNDKLLVSLQPHDKDGSIEHFPFGFGRHFCLGANWVRLICRVAIRTLNERFQIARIPHVTRAVCPSSVVQGLMEMEAVLTLRKTGLCSNPNALTVPYHTPEGT